MRNLCGRCERCQQACPTEAFLAPGKLDARRCISYLTIEQKGEIPEELRERIGRRVYGCDACQQCCPWNRYALPTKVADYTPREALLSLSPEQLERMTEEEYLALFAGTAVKRAGLSGLQRTIRDLRANFSTPTLPEEAPSVRRFVRLPSPDSTDPAD